MKTILCPTDFSDASNNAIAYAAKLAQKFEASLTLLQVQSAFELSPAEMIRGRETSTTRTWHALEAQSREVTRAFKISCYAEATSAPEKLSAAIHDQAERFDLIVMGSNGPDDLYQLLFGSNTYNAILKSNKPVIVVPAGLGYSAIRSMVYAFDYLRNRTLPLTHLVPLVQKLSCRLTVLQVMEDAYSQDAEEELKELQYIIDTYHHRDLKEIKYDTVRDADIAQAINRYMLKNMPDALALCSEHHSLAGRIFHKSVIKQITAICNYPVIIFPH
ncbi:universal stress protein [Dawidia soli]|uniref:Universal stress protein n=1 Tax=Dawidia soli TaxID=2782352 RepID=A0AAP2GHY0_9BACT|nr:universal stress protein [Dawidia soli]MBT1686468.1 universal stress protein [Dawidia soli]